MWSKMYFKSSTNCIGSTNKLKKTVIAEKYNIHYYIKHRISNKP